MTYQVSGTVQATDYNTLATSLNAIWASGSGDKGWGQTAVPTTIAVDNTVLATEWLELFNKVNYMSVHESGANVINASDFSTSASFPVVSTATSGIIGFCNTLTSGITTVGSDTNRFNTTSYSSDISSSGSYSASWTSAINATATVSFGSGDLARWFFNAGGRVYLTVSHSGGSSPQASNWSSVANAAGTMWISAKSVGGTAQSGRHYWGSGGTIYSGSGSGAYSSNNLTISISGNGGSSISFSLAFRDNHTNQFFDTVSGTFSVTCFARPPGLGGPISNPGWTPSVSVSF